MNERDPNPKYCLVSESFAGTIPFLQASKAISAALKSERRTASRRTARTLKALDLIPKDWRNPSIGIVTDHTGGRFIIAIPSHQTTTEE